MPTLITHNYFSKDVFEKMNKNLQKKLEPSLKLYHVFAQSFDNLFYYRIPIIIGKNIRSFGYYCQHNNTQSYFINMIRLIQDKNLQNDSEALAYLYGSLTHYVLDSTCHPYVFYKTGVFKSNDKKRHQYNGLHARMEYMLDSYLYSKNENLPFFKYKFYKDILPKVKPTSKLLNLIDENYKKTFNKNNMSKYYFKGYNWSRFSYRIFAYDPTGIKKLIYTLIDKITPSSIQNIRFYSLNIKEVDQNYLNNDRLTWLHPCNNKIKFNYSFEDLYDLALNKTIEIIQEVNKVLENKSDIKDLIKFIPNIDYATGLLIQKNKAMEYFET